MKKFILISIILVAIFKTESYSCTIIMVSDLKVILAGSNEDSTFPLTTLWFVPATDESYGRICLGYKMMMNSTQGGMNEKGLFLDGNSLSKQGWESDESKKALFGSLLDRLLATCANIEEVKEFFNTYNIPALDQARIPVMDRSGESMIVEWHNGKVIFLETDKPYQIATNFVGSKYIGVEKPCWRYKKANEMLQDKEAFSLNTVRDALDATHQESKYSSTVYSFICDLQEGEIYVYNYYDFSKQISFKLKEELSKGYKEYYLSKLFTEKNEDYKKFISEGPANMIEFGYNRINKKTAMMFFGMLKFQYPTAFNRNIGINALSQLGVRLTGEGKLEDAEMFLERNMSEFPDSARVHFELANVYIKTNNKELALAEYKKTLAINPYHKQAKQALENLLHQ
ncbi:MAG: carcinine hydrolase/isopenicillin-N N-acyltransferase family protein [Bacteroidales bacterium]|nr:carcinine hydrolase/isopenicillin-N N-acyltransferase family protein [Bacteroidales bacterium]